MEQPDLELERLKAVERKAHRRLQRLREAFSDCAVIKAAELLWAEALAAVQRREAEKQTSE